MTYHCEMKEQAPQPTLAVRARTAVTGLPEQFGRAYAAIGQYLVELGERPAGPPYAAYFNMDMADLEVEIGMPVARPLAGRGEVQPGEIPGGKTAVCLYTGPYDGIGSAYTALSDWIQAQGYTAAGPAYEHYLNDPATAPPQALQTLVAFPLRAA